MNPSRWSRKHGERRLKITLIIEVLKQKAEKARRADERLQTETETTFCRKPASTRSHPARKHPVRLSPKVAQMSVKASSLFLMALCGIWQLIRTTGRRSGVNLRALTADVNHEHDQSRYRSTMLRWVLCSTLKSSLFWWKNIFSPEIQMTKVSRVNLCWNRGV